MKQLRKLNPNIKIVPRISIPANQEKLLRYVASFEGRNEVIDAITELLSAHEFDGIVLDSPVFSYLDQIPLDFLSFVKELKEVMEEKQKSLIISVLGKQSNFGWKAETMKRLLDYSDKLLICIYDFGEQQAGMQPLAPKKWFRENLDYFYKLARNLADKQKIMAGFPFYGNYRKEQASQPINGAQVLQQMREGKLSYQWRTDLEECYTQTQKSEKITYPCLKFFLSRKETLALNYPEVGAFIWEAG